MMLTQKLLCELLAYDSESGVFTRLVRTSNRIRVGDCAGSLDAKGYLCIRVDGKTYKAHRLAWLYVYGSFPKDEIDHINECKADNRIANLRDVKKSINQHNRSAVKGYFRDKKSWRAKLSVDGEVVHVGCFSSEIEARSAYLEAKQTYALAARKGGAS